MSSSKKGKGKSGAGSKAGESAMAAAMSDVDYAALLKRAEEAIDEVNLEVAALLYEEALLERPDDVKVIDALGEIAYLMGDHDRAEELFCKSAEVSPGTGYSKWMHLGQLYEGAEAVVAYKKGVELLAAQLAALPADAPERPRLQRELSDAYNAVAELYMTDLCDEDDAEGTASACAERAVEADGDNPEAHRVLANVRMCQKRPGDAAPHLSKAVALCEALYPEEDAEDGDSDDETAGEGAASASAAASKAAAGEGGKGRARRKSEAPASLRAAAAAASAAGSAAAGSSSGAAAGAGSGAGAMEEEGAGSSSGATDAAAAGKKAGDRTGELPPFDARKELAKACMELELYSDALTALGRLSDEDDADMEVAYLTGEAFHLSGDAEGALTVLQEADEALSAAIDRITAASRRERSKKKTAVGGDTAAAYTTDGLMRFDLDDLQTQRKMIRKLRDVVLGHAPAAGAAAAGAGADSAPATAGGAMDEL
jgi:tetratricopeptide (TPR) repeat protein